MLSICSCVSSYLLKNFASGFALPNSLSKKPCFSFGFNSSTLNPLMAVTILAREFPASPRSLFLTPSSIFEEIAITSSCAFEPNCIMDDELLKSILSMSLFTKLLSCTTILSFMSNPRFSFVVSSLRALYQALVYHHLRVFYIFC